MLSLTNKAHCLNQDTLRLYIATMSRRGGGKGANAATFHGAGAVAPPAPAPGAVADATASRSGRDLPPNFVSLDVECIAISNKHHDVRFADRRVPATVCIVDHNCEILLNEVIAVPPTAIFSYLTPLTGLTEASFRCAKPEDVVLSMVHAVCTPDTTIVGQSPASDLKWLGLQQGKHYKAAVDISELYKTFNHKSKTYWKYSLQNTAAALLGVDMTGAHSAEKDAIAGMKLYKLWYAASEKDRKAMHRTLATTTHPPSVVKLHNYRIDGVCMDARRFCSCTPRR